MSRNLLLLLILTVSFDIVQAAKKTVLVSLNSKAQIIEGFGASDGWHAQCVGDWNEASKAPIAELLFSKAFDSNGDPLGIGLSRWRFNIGSGSASLGEDSNIEDPSRRTEGFLQSDGTYDWTQQAGEQWFLKQAKAYGVEKMIAWINSPPIYYTKTGRGNTNNTANYGVSNLKAENYDDFGLFAATVLEHFKEDEDIRFNMLSPLNEPQYKWADGQEGTPWTNIEIAQVVGEVNAALVDKNLDTEIFVAEAGSYNYITSVSGEATHSDQIDVFFDPSSPLYLGDYSNVVKGVSTHSYWVNNTDEQMKATRKAAHSKAAQRDIKIYQTEYSMLSIPDDSDFPINSKFDRALFLAKLIHYDLKIANCVSWSYWTAMDRERWNHSNRFYLIQLVPNNGIYGDFSQSTSGAYTADKNLWTLGNYSRFIRPGYTRLNTMGVFDNADFMSSSYLSPDSSQLVSVYVNTSTVPIDVEQKINLPAGMLEGVTDYYVTNKLFDLSHRGQVNKGETITISSRSVVTIVTELVKATVINDVDKTNNIIFFPNPMNGKVLNINGLLGGEIICFYDTSGNLLKKKQVMNNSSSYSMPCNLASGSYFIKIHGHEKQIQHILMVE